MVLARLDAAYGSGEPVLTFWRKPDWAHADHHLVRMEMLQRTPICYSAGGDKDCDCQTDVVAKRTMTTKSPERQALASIPRTPVG